ncbi:MAG: N-acetylmuramoyl-L-alanine amidase [Oscillospiraceae bacterium]|nr:N-acetylmuramoyl-L-alanine amidase [Oscillospiraceae bacterium]
MKAIIAVVMALLSLSFQFPVSADEAKSPSALETLIHERIPYENPRSIIITQPQASTRSTTASSVSILGACDYEYPLYMNGKEIEKTERGFFAVYVELTEGVNTFVFTNNNKEETVVITRKAAAAPSGVYVAPKPSYYDKPFYGRVKLDSITHRKAPDESPTLLTPLAYGTTFNLLGEINDYYIIDGGTYVYKSAVNAFEGKVPGNVISGMEIVQKGDFAEFALDMNVNSLYSLDVIGNKAKLTVTAQRDSGRRPQIPQGSLIRRISKASAGNGRISYNLEFWESPVGHYVEFKNGRMTVGFKQAAKALDKARVVLDAGHGGNDPGALGPPGEKGPFEKDFNLYVTLKAKEYLESQGVTVLLTRSDDTAIPLADRTAAILNYKPDISVAVHTNSMPVSADYRTVRGARMYYTFDTGKSAAESIKKQISESLGFEYIAPIRENFALSRLTVSPAMLFEMNFMCSPDDYEWLLNTKNLDKMGEALGKAIVKQLTVKTEAETPPPLAPLSAADDLRIRESYAAYTNMFISSPFRFTANDFQVSLYFGTYNGCEVVSLTEKDKMYTSDIKVLSVGRESIYLPSGGMMLHLHKDSSFIEISEAYAAGYLSDRDIFQISYYSNPGQFDEG